MKQSRHFWRGLFFIFLIAALYGGLTSPAVSVPVRAAPQMDIGSGDVIISEFRTRGSAGGNDEFVELFNPTAGSVSIAGWIIRRSSGCGSTTASIATIPTGVVLSPGVHYLIGGSSYNDSVIPDFPNQTLGVADSGGIALFLADGTTLVDQVGLCTTTSYVDGSALNPLTTDVDRSYERKLGGATSCQDTDNNSFDFQLITPSDPQNLSSPANPCTPITVTNVTSSVLDTTYTTADVIDITITFNGQVNVAGSPTLLLETGVTDRPATYASGSGTNALLFNYTVTAGDSSADLDYVATNSLSGGTITGATGEVILTLPSPGLPGSLGANKNIVIDTPPSVISFSRQTPSSTTTNADVLTFRVTFSEAVANVDISDFLAMDTTGTPISVNPVSPDVYDVTISGGDLPSFNGTVGLNLSATQNIADATGNPLPTIEPATDQTYTLDNVAPTVTINQTSGQLDPATTLPISFTVVFSEPINFSEFIATDITQNGTATGITWAITNPSNDQRNFVLQATAVTGVGTLIPIIAADRVIDLAGNNNTASTSTDNTVTLNTMPTGSATSVVISEFRTTGPNGADDEFIEIYNPTSNPVDISGWLISASNNSGTTQTRATIPTSTLLRSGQYYLVAHNNYINTSVPPNLRYGTSIANNGGIALIGPNSQIIDEVGMDQDSFYQEGDTLNPLSGTSNQSYERQEGGTSDSCVDTDDNDDDFSLEAPNTLHNYSSPLSLCGTLQPTPSTTTTTITADTPDPSLVNGNVTVSVSVTGGSSTPSGKVNITGANTNCTITLSTAGTGSCTAKFTSTGTKTLTATYLGDNTHLSSSDTETHQVTTSSGAIPTPTRVPTLAPPPPLIGINEFVPRPGHDWNNDGVINVDDEYIELINHGVIDVNLSSYTLDDEVNIGSTPFTLPSITLKPGERHVFYGSETGLLLSDGGDGVRLLRLGQLVDAYNYSVVRFPDQAYCRLPDNGGLDDWSQNCFPTPGLQNSQSASSVNPPTSGDAENLCPIADTLPAGFVLAECLPFGNNIWNSAYWDQFGWFNERYLPESSGKWPVFVD